MTTPRTRLLELGIGKPTVEVLEAGDGPPLLYLHGIGGADGWPGALPRLSERFHVYAPLLPGFGRSTGIDFLDDQLDLFFHGFDVVEALGLERPAVLGESMGGWLAAEMAALRPKEIGRLVLTSPLGLWRDTAPPVDLFGLMTHELVPFLFHDTACPAAQAMLSVNQLLGKHDDRTDEQVEVLIAMARGMRTAAKFLFPIPERGLEKRLHRITARTLVVWGAEDRFVAPSYGDIVVQRIPHAELHRIPGAGHLVALERTAPYTDAVLRFLTD